MIILSAFFIFVSNLFSIYFRFPYLCRSEENIKSPFLSFVLVKVMGVILLLLLSFYILLLIFCCFFTLGFIF